MSIFFIVGVVIIERILFVYKNEVVFVYSNKYFLFFFFLLVEYRCQLKAAEKDKLKTFIIAMIMVKTMEYYIIFFWWREVSIHVIERRMDDGVKETECRMNERDNGTQITK